MPRLFTIRRCDGYLERFKMELPKGNEGSTDKGNRDGTDKGKRDGKKRDYARYDDSQETRNETPAKKSAHESFFDGLGDIMNSNKQRMQDADRKAIRRDIMSLGKEETHNTWVVEPAKAFLKSDYRNVGAMNEAFKPIMNVYGSKLELLNETPDGKEAKAFGQLSDTREKPEAVTRYEGKKLNLDVEHLLGLKNALKMLENDKNDKKSEKYKEDLLEKIKLQGIDNVYNETEKEIRRINPEPEKEDKMNEFLKANRDAYGKKLRHLNETPDGKEAKAFGQLSDTREKPEAVTRYEGKKLNLDVDHIFDILAASSTILYK